MTRKPLAVANWKMNHGVADTIKFITEFSRSNLPEHVEIVICPPFTSLYTISIALEEDSPLRIGAQNCHYEHKGAYTGEISLDFLKEVSCRYVIVGHSERRKFFHEDGNFLAKKVLSAIESGINPIYCVGETESQRDEGKTFEVIKEQLESGLEHIDKDMTAQLVIAYEPVWAIGTGKTATPEIAQEVHHFIRKWLGERFGTSYANNIRILYGGSVKPENTHQLMLQEDIDGALVGGASLDPVAFQEIVTHCR